MNLKRLPDAEFEIMKIIWRSEQPITMRGIINQMGPSRSWKPQTVLTFLARLIEKKFLSTEKVGNSRNYIPTITEEDYMRIETGGFLSRYRGNSLGSLVRTMYDGEELSSEDIQELKAWLNERER